MDERTPVDDEPDLDLYAGEVPTCGCNDEYGPCDDHAEIVIEVRNSKERDSDALTLRYLQEVARLSPTALVAAEIKILATAERGLPSVSASSIDDAVLSEMEDLAEQVEDRIRPPFKTFWDDGFRIVKITGGPLLLD